MNRFDNYMKEIEQIEERRRIEEEERIARLKREEEERRKALEERRKAEISRMTAETKGKLEAIKQKKHLVRAKMASMPIASIHFKAAPSTIKRCITLQRRLSAMEQELGAVSEDTGFFKQPWFFWLSFALSLVVSFLWISSSFGTDAIGGSELETSFFIIIASLCLDLVFFVFIASVLILLEKLLSPKSYVKLINVVAISAGVIGLLTFLANLIFRIMKV